jgi:hypothetical protein
MTAGHTYIQNDDTLHPNAQAPLFHGHYTAFALVLLLHKYS